MDIPLFLTNLGIESEFLIKLITYSIQIVTMFLIGWVSYFITKKWVSKGLLKIAKRTSTTWDDMFFDSTFFKRLGLLVAPIMIVFVSNRLEWHYLTLVNQILNIWISISVLLMLTSILDVITRIYENFSVSKSRPVRVIMQVVKIFLYCITIIVIVSSLTSKDPKTLIAGLGVMTSVLMLVFKDTILGLVAGIQLSSNNMIKIGDWIEMPSSRADGDVIEISLTTVKVQNWDRTITTIPTYKLVSESFSNWRGMVESGGRRIKRSINIDVDSVRYLTDSDIVKLKESALLKDYIEQKVAELEKWNATRSSDLDERKMTNIGTFRGYIESWLISNPNINLNMTHMVRQLQPGPTGLPLEIYCFSANKQWIAYENIQSDIFDHIYAVMPLFGLRAFQYSNASLPYERGA